MTDPLAPLSDEDLSSLLDGQADPAVLDRLARDPAARARRDALAAAAAAVGAEPVAPLAPAQVDDLVARALAAGPSDAAAPPDHPHHDPTPAPAPVTPLAPPVPRGRRTPPIWLVAAAVVALVAIGLGLIWSGASGDDHQDTASSATEGSDDLAMTGEAGGAERTLDDASEPESTSGPLSATPHTDGDVQSETAPTMPSIEDRLGPPVDLGDFPDDAALRAAVATAFPTDGPPAERPGLPTDAAFQRCAEQMRVQFSIEDPAARYGFALVDDVASMVYEFDAATFDNGEPAVVLTAVRADTCDPYFTIQR